MRMGVRIRRENFDACLAAINAINDSEAPDLLDALAEWFHEGMMYEDGYEIYDFTGEKWRDEETLYQAIAPYAEGKIECYGEDGELWGYEFQGGKMYHTKAEFVRVPLSE
jgi:hypothetical protein